MTVVLLYIDMNINTVHMFFTYYQKTVSCLQNLYIFASLW